MSKDEKLPSSRTIEAVTSYSDTEPRLIIGIGASAGGLEALTRLLQSLPANTGMAFVIVQHLDPAHDSALTQILAKSTSLPTVEITDGLTIAPNYVYVIPPNANLSVSRGVLRLEPRDTARGGTRSIDVFFESLAQDKQDRAAGVILSGTASDGTLGLEAIKAEGGITFAQDETARYDSMPRSAIATGCVDFVLTPENIAAELGRIAQHPYVASGRPDTGADDSGSDARHDEDVQSETAGQRKQTARPGDNDLNKILLLLRTHAGVDFTLYKSNTIQRRIARRIVLNKLDGLDGYATFLRGNDAELEALYADLLIGVTEFFRNPDAFEFLKRNVLPKLVAERRADPLRIWVLGCSTGQEAYSLAMACTEFFDQLPRSPKLQIFATDLSESMLGRARAGLYSEGMVATLSPERLRRFFTEESGGYRICKPLRDAVVFARQNLLSDPPFSRMDLISCRNLLIYLAASPQQTILSTFHYALKPKGYLFLGASESIGSFTDLFEPVDKKHRIYGRKPGRAPALAMHLGPPMPVSRQDRAARNAAVPEGFHTEINAQREADRVVLNRFAPIGVLVNAEFQVLQFRGDTSRYLKPPTGQATLNVLKMARDGLMLPLRAALNEAKKKAKAVRRENVGVGQNGKTLNTNVEVVPLKNLKERCYLIFFEEASDVGRGARPRPSPEQPIPTRSAQSQKEQSSRIAELERELAEARDYVQSIQEQYEAANEELQASNEEVTSSNEELQSLNEEMETSKEELESANEELTTVNDEMANRNAELGRINNDLVNLQTGTKLAIVLLGRDLTIRRFSPQAEKQFGLVGADIGRPFTHIRHNLNMTDLEGFIAGVIDAVQEREADVQDKDERWHSLRVRPYLTLDNKIDGAVLVLVDIDALKHAELAAAAAREQADAVIRTTPDPLLVLGADLHVRSANEGFYRTFGLVPADAVGRSIFDLDRGAWNIPKLRELLEEILPRNSFFDDFEVMHNFDRLGRRTMLLNARTLNDRSGQPAQILLGIRDLTNVVAFQAEMRRSEMRYRRLFEAARDGVLILDCDTRKIVDANPFIAELLGYTRQELCGKELFEIGLLKDRAANAAAFHTLLAEGRIRYDNLPLRATDGAIREVEFVSSVYQEDGERIIQCNIRDIGERREAEEHQLFLMAELDHRVRNTLSGVMAIARQTVRHSASLQDFRKSFEARLMALSNTHRLLTISRWRSASLLDIMQTELAPFAREGRQPFAIAGAELRLNPKQALAMSLGIHELATNAAKYGALGAPNGVVEVSWEVERSGDQSYVNFRWVETGGPRVELPGHKGFGSTLLEHGLKAELDAEVLVDYQPDGLRCRLRIPLDTKVT